MVQWAIITVTWIQTGSDPINHVVIMRKMSLIIVEFAGEVNETVIQTLM